MILKIIVTVPVLIPTFHFRRNGYLERIREEERERRRRWRAERERAREEDREEEIMEEVDAVGDEEDEAQQVQVGSNDEMYPEETLFHKRFCTNSRSKTFFKMNKKWVLKSILQCVINNGLQALQGLGGRLLDLLREMVEAHAANRRGAEVREGNVEEG